MSFIMGQSVSKISVLSLLLFAGVVQLGMAQQPAKQAEIATPQVAIAATETSQNVDKTPLPADFPVFRVSGDEAKDNADYADRKAKWIEENPVRYAKLTEEENR